MSVTVESTWLVLGAVSFLPATAATPRCDVADSDDPAGTDGAPALGAGDHVKTQAPPTKFALRSGTYCEARLPLDLSVTPPEGAPASLAGHSVLVSGTLEDGTAFEIRSAVDTALRLRSTDAEGFTLDATHAGVLFGFDLAYWLGDLAWSSTTRTNDGAVIADDTSNTDLLRAFERKLAAGVSLFRDDNRDGLLDDKRDPIARGSVD